MTIETIQKMISDAPAASKWWGQHHFKIVRSKKIRAWVSCVFAVGTVGSILGFLFEDDPLLSMLYLVGVIGLMVAGIVCEEFISKEYRRGLNMLHLFYLRNLEIPATSEHQEPVFRVLLKTQSKTLQQCGKDLLALRNAPLPAVWWVALHEHIEAVIAQDKQEAMWAGLSQQIEQAGSSLSQSEKGGENYEWVSDQP